MNESGFAYPIGTAFDRVSHGIERMISVYDWATRLLTHATRRGRGIVSALEFDQPFRRVPMHTASYGGAWPRVLPGARIVGAPPLPQLLPMWCFRVDPSTQEER